MDVRIKTVLILFLMLKCVALFGQKSGPPDNVKDFEKSYQQNIKLESINGVYIPKNIEDAYNELDKKIDQKSREKFKRTSIDTISKIAVKSLGTWMIMNWNFYEGSRLGAFLKEKGVYHPEDMAKFLVLGYYHYLNKLPFDDKKMVTEFQKTRKEQVQNRKKKG
jgi:hypothetical protein